MCRAYIGPQILVMACDARKNSGAARKLGSTDSYVVKTKKKQAVLICHLFDRGFEDRVGHVLQHPTAPELDTGLGELISCIEHGQTRIRAMKTLRNAVLGRIFGYSDTAQQQLLGHDVPVACRADKSLSVSHGTNEPFGELDLAMASLTTSQCVCNLSRGSSGQCLGSGNSSSSQALNWNAMEAKCWMTKTVRRDGAPMSCGV